MNHKDKIKISGTEPQIFFIYTISLRKLQEDMF